MTGLIAVAAEEWYETIAMADGVTLVHEPWIKPFYLLSTAFEPRSAEILPLEHESCGLWRLNPVTQASATALYKLL